MVKVQGRGLGYVKKGRSAAVLRGPRIRIVRRERSLALGGIARGIKALSEASANAKAAWEARRKSGK